MLSRRIKQTISTILSLCMLLSMTCMAVNAQEDRTQISLYEYANNEVLVMNKDGSFDVLKYESIDALQKGLETIADDENIKLYQPNYSYEAQKPNNLDDISLSFVFLYDKNKTTYLKLLKSFLKSDIMIINLINGSLYYRLRGRCDLRPRT